MEQNRFFKGWAKPGPFPPGAEPTAGPAPEPGESLDALSGNYRIFQYRDGHRFSTDDVLVAWYGTSWVPRAERVLDLGSGIGSVGMTAAWRLPSARFTTVEAQAISVRLARKSAAYNGILERYEIRQGDFRDSGVLGPDERFDLILGSPPYFPEGTGPVGDHPQKVACRFELRGDVGDYCAVATRHLDWGGVFAGIFPAVQRERVEAGVRAAGGTLVRTRDVVFKEGEAPLLFLFLMMRRDHLPEALHDRPWDEPALVIRTAQGQVHPEYERVKLSFGFPP
jgi:tRNA1Val (adenine37-N6)-methyltransferase